MNHQTNSRAHANAGIQHVNGGSVLRVEPVQASRGTHAHDQAPAREDVQCGQASQQIRVVCCVDPAPYPLDAARFHLHIELLASHYRQELSGGGESPAFLYERYRVSQHSASMLTAPVLDQSPLWTPLPSSRKIA